MQIIAELRRQHRLIETFAGSLNFWASRGVDHPDAAADHADLVRFVRGYVVGHHHQNEELLFEALVGHGEIPDHRGPLVILRREHLELETAVGRFDRSGATDGSTECAAAIAADLWRHIDKEESVLLLEAERRLIDGGVRRLEALAPSREVEALEALGADLVDRLPPKEDPDLIRGDGCIACSAFGEDCHGIETEWWSDWERDHYAALDEG